jgi:transposase
MQGIKDYHEKLFVSFRLSERVPQENFYRKLANILDLSYLRQMTKSYYGAEGQKSIDSVVFFKLMLIGYLENINSDRKIIEQAGMRMDMLYFLGYDIDERLPWHSTLSRTRKLFGEDVFLELFRNILRLCVLNGMVSGKTQAIDSAFIKANASMDSLVERELQEKSKQFFDEVTENEEDKNETKKEMKAIDNQKHSSRFVSTTDPDARVSQKQRKLPALNHLGIISVDAENHVICGAMADFADKKDSDTTEKIVCQTIENMEDTGLEVEEVLGDTGKGRQKMRLRGSTVEPVWGTLLNFRCLRKIYTKGNDLANKQVLMAAAAYNLKKFMNFRSIKPAISVAKLAVLSKKSIILSEILTVYWSYLKSNDYADFAYCPFLK